jgi:hypothetical protein
MSETLWNIFAIIGIMSVGATLAVFIMSMLILGERNEVLRRKKDGK